MDRSAAAGEQLFLWLVSSEKRAINFWLKCENLSGYETFI